ncbi:MAG: cbb3-type cytochrome c oxidase N-terminal domain-containing protein [Bacteriovoracia bacterium]
MSESNSNDKIHIEADEKHLVLDHSYDGIQELNHPLPSWWNVLFYVGIIFAICYTIYYEFMGGKSLKAAFNEDYSRIKVIQEEYKKLHGPFDPNQYAAYSTADNLKTGEAVYVENCMQCHMEGGKGDIGPNLTDKHWILAKGTPDTIYQVVYTGSEENGMPAWGEILSSEDMYRVVAYVMTFKNTFHKEGKEPQGELIND